VANPNIVNTTAIYGKTDVQNIGTTATSITENQSSSGKVLKVNTLVVAAVGSSDAVITVGVHRGGVTYNVAKGMTVPSGSSIAVLAKENPVYLEEGDSLRLSAAAVDSAHGVCSYEEIA
jgi:hypothetical protein